MKYGFGIKIIPNQKLAFLEYVFYDLQGEEIDMKEEIRNQIKKTAKGIYSSPSFLALALGELSPNMPFRYKAKR